MIKEVGTGRYPRRISWTLEYVLEAQTEGMTRADAERGVDAMWPKIRDAMVERILRECGEPH
jgi:hypothetical protein